ncbi:GH3 auxin-responsive promoter [Lanmaoa asiatica]|nr:GH3 auxin-responsive promoter [Lanmaoa asiatica]
MALTQTCPNLRQSLTPELRSTAIERTELLLLKIVRANLNTQYASKTTSLAEFRDAILAHGSTSDVVLVEDFRRCVPLSDYDAYKPFMTLFDKPPYKEAELEDLFAPGLPLFLAVSSATSGREPKLLPKYPCSMPNTPFGASGLTSMVLCYSYREVKEVEREPGQIVKKIPVSTVSGGRTRARMGWSDIDDDDSRMSLIMPGFVAPWAASMIKHHKSFLMIHALFTLACRDLDYIFTSFSTLFYDLVRHVDEEWDMFLSSIRDGTVPDLAGVGEVRSHLEVHLHADPDRAAELREIGPPLSCEGWAARVWPQLRVVTFVKSVIGPTVAIRTPGYGSTESPIAVPHRPDDLDTFVLRSKDLIEFLDVTTEESHENLRQAWELEVGKQYEFVLTTNDGLWRYRLGDVIDIVGFDANNGSPVFVYSGRRRCAPHCFRPCVHRLRWRFRSSLAIRLTDMLVTDAHLTPAIRAVGPDVMQVTEFTTVLDDRPKHPDCPNAHLAPSKLAEGLVAANTEFQRLLEAAAVRSPTVRIVRPGTFAGVSSVEDRADEGWAWASEGACRPT